jgi:cytochrome c553
MRLTHLLLVLATGSALACSPAPDSRLEESGDPAARQDASADMDFQASFDGADYSESGEMRAHGERVAGILACNSCHLEDYSGANFGEMIPLIEGLWATNISLTLPEFSDTELERLLREGVHPAREIYLMPSKQSQFLSRRDMDALIAYLRTIEPVGEPTPLPPPGFEEAVTARLPDDYWRTTLDGQPRTYHNAAEEAAYFAASAPPDFGSEYAQGRLVVLTACTSCHGAAMDGVGEPAGDIQAALEYDDAQFQRLLREGVDRTGQAIELPWGEGHASLLLTDGEIEAAISYTRLLAERRADAE